MFSSKGISYIWIQMGVERQQKAVRAIYLGIVGNFLLAFAKGLAGFFGNSYALMADAIESTTDVFSSLLLLFGLKYTHRPADENHPYGHGRAEPLFTFLVVVFLVTSAVIIAVQAIENISTPHELPKPYTLLVLTGVIAIKEVFYRFVHKRSEETHSTSLKADAWHHRSDAITSLAAFIGISVALYFGKGYESADDWAALLASIAILYNSYLLLRPALGEIMDEQLYGQLEREIRQLSGEVEGVLGTEKCRIRKVGMNYFIDLHVIVNGNLSVREGHVIAHALKDHLRGKLEHLADVFIHIEPDR